AKEMVSRKLIGQENVVRSRLQDSATADAIAHLREALNHIEKLDDIRTIESRSASAYWSSWSGIPIQFPKSDLRRVPEHWRVFRNRHSPLTASCRLAANPVNAMLNYLYAVLECETFLAVTALGLDPGLAFMHTDTRNRDSLACDVMEPIRPQVDAFLLDWITAMPLKREWFFEQRDGSCRLTSELASRLSDTAPMWQRTISPIAEWVAQTLWSMISKKDRQPLYPTRLTQNSKRKVDIKALGRSTHQVINICRGCGTQIGPDHRNCSKCAASVASVRMREIAKVGRIASHTPKAQAKRAETQRRNAQARYKWMPSSQPVWLTRKVFMEKIQPLLAEKSNSAIAEVLGVSLCYAADIRRARSSPHPRHWQSLADLVNVVSNSC
ncbi:MAG TPA: CRISPR-associated endonuclease Cas1, partial [Pirellula sp.]|nr:CRISPR-associated endonuclease Cas1 [Pirellula sp.]